MSTTRDLRPTWAEIDLSAFTRNVDAIAGGLPAGSRLIAVLKADAYGHGAVELAKRCAPDRVAMIAVALLEEALELRRAAIALPLLVLGPLTETQIAVAAEENVRPGIIGPEELESACRVAREREVAIHLKLDSGMGRMGILEGELPRVAEMIRSAPRLRLEAIYTHFANASDAEDPFAKEQIVRFERMCHELRHAGITAPHHHLANSAATVRGVVQSGDWVRVGVALYGAEALDRGGSRLEPLLRWRTEIARLKELPAGSPVGYGLAFRTTRPSRIAAVPAGYADGYERRLSNNAEVLVRGRRAPVVGRISMDLTTIDVTDVPDVRFGDEVVLLGKQGGDEISAEELGRRTGTISYEVFCRISHRVPRVYR
jgi:alanine racemase